MAGKLTHCQPLKIGGRMAKVKFKIDKDWNGIVVNNGVNYIPGESFQADESLGEGRPWLIEQPKNARLPEKSKDEKLPKNDQSEDKAEETKDKKGDKSKKDAK